MVLRAFPRSSLLCSLLPAATAKLAFSLDVDLSGVCLLPGATRTTSTESNSSTATASTSTSSLFGRIASKMRPALGKKDRKKTFEKAVGRMPTLEDVAELIRNRKVKNVVIMVSPRKACWAGGS